tara:strand:+ start:625 stop:1224 length:600 start_codon:yes stop_codon:yes gene_type:complete
MYRLDFSLADKTPYAIQYKEPCKGVLIIKSESKKYLIKICADLHYTLSNYRFGLIQPPKLFGKIDFKFKPIIFPGVESAGNDLINIYKSVYMYWANIHGVLNVICDGSAVENNFNFEEFNKIFESDKFFKDNIEEKKTQLILANQKKEADRKKLKKDLERFDKELYAKYLKERKEFAKKNNIPLPKEKTKGRDKLIWHM